MTNVQWVRSRSRRRAVPHAPTAGFALIELLVVCSMLAAVLVALLGLLDTAARTVPRDVERSHAVAESRVGVQRMVREIRQADVVYGASPNAIDFEVTLGGRAQHVMYACDVPDTTGTRRRCLRTQAPAGAPLPAPDTGTPVVVRLLNGTLADPVFSYTPDAVSPRYVTATVRVPSTGERAPDGSRGHDIVLDDGALLRNQDLGR